MDSRCIRLRPPATRCRFAFNFWCSYIGRSTYIERWFSFPPSLNSSKHKVFGHDFFVSKSDGRHPHRFRSVSPTFFFFQKNSTRKNSKKKMKNIELLKNGVWFGQRHKTMCSDLCSCLEHWADRRGKMSNQTQWDRFWTYLFLSFYRFQPAFSVEATFDPWLENRLDLRFERNFEETFEGNWIPARVPARDGLIGLNSKQFVFLRFVFFSNFRSFVNVSNVLRIC